MKAADEKILIEKVSQIHIVLLGIPDTDEGGLVTDVKCIRQECARRAIQLADHDTAIAAIEARCKERVDVEPRSRSESSKLRRQVKFAGLITASATVLSAIVYGIIELVQL